MAFGLDFGGFGLLLYMLLVSRFRILEWEPCNFCFPYLFGIAEMSEAAWLQLQKPASGV